MHKLHVYCSTLVCIDHNPKKLRSKLNFYHMQPKLRPPNYKFQESQVEPRQGLLEVYPGTQKRQHSQNKSYQLPHKGRWVGALAGADVCCLILSAKQFGFDNSVFCTGVVHPSADMAR